MCATYDTSKYDSTKASIASISHKQSSAGLVRIAAAPVVRRIHGVALEPNQDQADAQHAEPGRLGRHALAFDHRLLLLLLLRRRLRRASALQRSLAYRSVG